MPVFTTTDATFTADVIDTELPVLVDFWAAWCGPCKAIAPHLETLAKEYEGKLKVVKIEADRHPETTNQFNVTSLPTLIMFKRGKQVKKHVGSANLSKLKTIVDLFI